MWFEAPSAPVRGRRFTGGAQQIPRDQPPIADIHIRDAALRTDQRRGQLGDFVHDELRGPSVDDGRELRGAGLQFEVGEDLGEKEPALLVAAELLEPGKA